MKETQNITIRIADVPPMSMSIKPQTEEIVRIAERNVNSLWNKWRVQFGKKTSKEVLAMVAYQFAKHYYELLNDVDAEQSGINAFEAELDRLLGIAGSDTAAPGTEPVPDASHTGHDDTHDGDPGSLFG